MMNDLDDLMFSVKGRYELCLDDRRHRRDFGRRHPGRQAEGHAAMSKANGHPASFEIQFGRKRIEYQLQYAARKTLAIDVHPDLSVVVTAPTGSADTAVEKRVEKAGRVDHPTAAILRELLADDPAPQVRKR